MYCVYIGDVWCWNTAVAYSHCSALYHHRAPTLAACCRLCPSDRGPRRHSRGSAHSERTDTRSLQRAWMHGWCHPLLGGYVTEGPSWTDNTTPPLFPPLPEDTSASSRHHQLQHSSLQDTSSVSVYYNLIFHWATVCVQLDSQNKHRLVFSVHKRHINSFTA